MTQKSNKVRQAALRKRRAAQGLQRFEYFLTMEEKQNMDGFFKFLLRQRKL